jgi:phosphoribosyl-ATP pyrophosphohydrolase
MIEASELADLFCKPVLRGDDKTISRTKVVSEAGDVLWNLAMVLHQEGITLEEVAQYNIDKLQVRKLAGTIKGDGDR